MLIRVMSAAGVNGDHTDYMSRSDLAKSEGDVRPLFTSTDNSLSRRQANQYLSNNQGRPEDGAGFELVVSVDDLLNYNRLHLTAEGRKEQFRAVIREGMERLLTDMGVEARWVAAIHLNTDNPHCHIVVANDCIDLQTRERRDITDIPRTWKFSKEDEPSRAAKYFEPSFTERQLPLPPRSVRTIPPSYVIRDEMPARARGDLFGVSAQQQAYTYLLDEREISPALVQSLLDNGSLYASEYGVCVFVNRDERGNALGATVRDKVVGSGQFYIGDLRTATRFILVDSPVEALSLYDLHKDRELSNAVFVALNETPPTDELLSQIAARGERARVVWARGLDEAGAQNLANFDETRTRLAALGADAVEMRLFAPNPALGRTWNEQLIKGHLQGEIATIEQNAEARARGEQIEPVAVEERAPVELEAQQAEAGAAALSVEEAAPRSIADVLASLPVVATLPAEPDVLDGTRAYNQREAARVAARQKREQEDEALAGSDRAAPEAEKRQAVRVETDELRRTPLDQVMHAHGLRLTTRRGEKVYSDSNRDFAIKVTGQLFSNRKDSDRGGAGAIDLVMYLQGTDFNTARGWLTDNFHSGKPAKLRERAALREDKDEPKPLRLQPANNENLETVRAYLTERRGLAPELVDACIENGTLYANSMGSAVFVHRDQQGHITGADWRSTDSHLRGTISGTEKQFGWFYVGDLRTAKRYVLAEAGIDTLSYIELHKEADLSETCFISLNGGSVQRSLIEFIAARAGETDGVELVWALDNNPVGKKSREAENKSFARAMEILTDIETGLLVNVSRDVPQTKDWNDDLLVARGLLQVEPQEIAPPDVAAPVEEAATVEASAPAAVAPEAQQAEEKPDDIISVRQRETVGRDWEVNFRDGRYRFIGHAEDEADARQEARSYREALAARGTQVNNVGVYVEGIETVSVRTPKNFGIEIEVVQDVVDGHWRAAHDFSHPSGGASGPVSLFSQPHETREQAILSITEQAREYFEKLGRTSDSKGVQQAARGILRNISEFEAQFAQATLISETEPAGQVGALAFEGEAASESADVAESAASAPSNASLPEAGAAAGEVEDVQVVASDEPPTVDGWILGKDETNRRVSYFLRSERFTGYQISLYRSESDGTWHGEILTRQTSRGRASWEPARNGYNGPVADVVAEAERRGLYWETKQPPNKRAAAEAARAAEAEQPAPNREEEVKTVSPASEGGKFAGVSDAELIERMESASDFGYDDEGQELTRRLALEGKGWRWSQKGAVVGVANTVEIYEIIEREVEHGRTVETDRKGEEGDAGVPRAVDTDGVGLHRGAEAAGVSAVDEGGRASDAVRDDGGRDGEDVVDAARAGRGTGDGAGDRGADDAARRGGTGGLGEGGSGGRSGAGDGVAVSPDAAAADGVAVEAPPTVYAKIVTPDTQELLSSRTAAYDEAKRAAEAQGMKVVSRYVAGHAEGIEAARRMLESIGSKAGLELVTDKYELVLARTAGKNEVEMTREEYVERRHALSIRSHERGVAQNEAEVAAMGTRTNKRRTELERQIGWWREVLSDPERHLERARSKYVKEYEAIVCKAISKGVPVAPEIIEQSPAFRKAVTARERYDKGRNTSFANRSAAVDDSMQAERGYKVKRQDGKQITEEQKREIAAGVSEIESVVGPLAELLRTGDVTIAHTNGKHPFLSDAGGLYHSNERTVSIGIRSKLTGRPIPSLAHELLGHWLDNEAGVAEGVSVTRWTSSRSTRRTYTYLSEGDNDYRRDSSNDGGLIAKAKRLICNEYEVSRLLSNRVGKKSTREELIEKEIVKVSLGNYWRESCEVWARLCEQYVATKLEGQAEYSARNSYDGAVGYWKREDFEKLMPLIEEQIERRLSIVRAALTPEAARGMGAVDVKQELDVHNVVIETEAEQELPAPEAEAAAVQVDQAQPEVVAASVETRFSEWLKARGVEPQKFAPNRNARPSDKLLIEEGQLRVEHMAEMRAAGVAPADVDDESAAHRGRIEKSLPGYVRDLERDFTGVHTVKSVGTKQFLLGALSALDSLDRKAEGAANVAVVNTVAEGTRPVDALTDETEIPASVIRHVEFHLTVLRNAEAQLLIGREADVRFGAGTRYEDETWEKYREECLESRRQLSDFITKADGNGVDGAQVIDELGGYPQIIKSRMMLDDALNRNAEGVAVAEVSTVAEDDGAGRENWQQGDWPAINEASFFESRYGDPDTDPYMLLNEALRMQSHRHALIPLAEKALEDDINPATGRKFNEKDRKTFTGELNQLRAFYAGTYDEITSVLGYEAGEELRRRVEATDARSRDTLVNDYVQELAAREETRDLAASAEDADKLATLTRHIEALIDDSLSSEPSAVEAAEYNTATEEGFASEVAMLLREQVRREIAESVIQPVETDTTGARDRERELEERAERIARLACARVDDSLTMYGATGSAVDRLKKGHEGTDEEIAAEIASFYKPKAPMPERTPSRARGRNEQQGSLFVMEDEAAPAPPPAAKPPAASGPREHPISAQNITGATVYRSGVSSITDLRAYVRAGAPVGVVASLLTEPAIDELIAYNNAGGSVFLDSGAFGARKGGSVDFGKVLARYDLIFVQMDNKNNVALVMPDVVGDQQRSLELIAEHRESILFYIENGADTLIPIQRGELTLSEAYNKIVETLGTNNFRVAIPSNQKAVPQDELIEFLRESKPARIHLLGISEANRRFDPLVEAIQEALPEVELSADANRLRALIGRNRKLTEAVNERLDEYAHLAVLDGDERLQMEDETEALFNIYNTPQYFNQEQAEAFARYLTDDAAAQARIIEAATNPLPAEARTEEQAAEIEDLDGDEYGSRLGYVLDELYPGDRWYREAIFNARYQMARAALKETELPARVREEELTRIETESRGEEVKAAPTALEAARELYSTYRQGLDTADAPEAAHFEEGVDLLRTNPEMLADVLAGTIEYLGRESEDAAPFIALSEQAARELGQTPAPVSAEIDLEAIARERAERFGTTVEVVEAATAAFYNAEDESTRLPNSTGSESLADYINYYMQQAELAAQNEQRPEEIAPAPDVVFASHPTEYLLVTGGLGEVSSNYGGNRWRSLNADNTLWHGPAEHGEWLKGRLESGTYRVEFVYEDHPAVVSALDALRAATHEQLTDLEAIEPATLRAGDIINLHGEDGEHLFELTVRGRTAAGSVQVEFTPDETGRIKLFTDSAVAREWLENIEEQGRDGGFSGGQGDRVYHNLLDATDPRVRAWDFESLPDSRVTVSYAGYSAAEVEQVQEAEAVEASAPVEQGEGASNSFWRVGGEHGGQIVYSAGYERDEAKGGDVVRVVFNDGHSATFSPHEIFPAKLSEVCAAFGNEAGARYLKVVAGSELADIVIEAANDEARGEAPAAEKAEPPKPREPNYIITDVHLHDEGLKTRFKNNVAAIETLRLIESEERAATQDEKEILARYSGWGAMPGAFNKYDREAGQWTKERDQLQRLLTPEEWEAASRSTLNAHYTHPTVVDAMWRATKRMGFEGGRVLEPAMGIGTFFGRVPEDLRDKVQLTGIELDGLTGRMARLLYPQADIHVKGFQDVHAPDNWYDVVISNVPFGDYSVHDPEYNKYKANIHDYFFLKSLDKVREGGLVVCISSTYTMDKQQTAIREKLAEKADLVAAIRLPNDAFKSNAGTEVVTDIIILQKRPSLERRLALAEQNLRQKQEASANLELKLTRVSHPDVYLQSVVTAVREQAERARKDLERAEAKVEHLKAGGTNGVAWTQLAEVEDPDGGDPIPVNEYFEARPYMIMGMLNRHGTMYHGGAVTVELDGGLDDLLFNTVSTNIPRDIYEAQGEVFEAGGIERLVTDDSIKAGSYVIQEGKLFQRVKNVLVEREADAETVKRAEKMLAIRDCVRRVFDAELKGEMGVAGDERQQLNREYDRFAARYGPLHNPVNQKTLDGDPDLHVLLALESKYTPRSGNRPARAVKADIFTKPTLRSYERPTSADGINAAISITLNEYGRLNLDRVAELLDKEHGDIETELRAKGLAYQNPRGLGWEMRDDYLAGNVRAKLVEAKEAAREDDRFVANVAALEEVQPKDIDYVDISARLGSSWIPATDVADFMAHLVGGEASDFNVKYSPLTGSWGVGYTPAGASKHRFKPAAVEIWGTGRADLIDVAQHALDSRAVIVRDKVAPDKYVINKEETEAANAKVAAVKAEFREWLWTDPERRARLHRHYNDNFNNIVEKKFDGSHLTFPGMATEIDGKPFSLREHQANAVWRFITTGKAVFGHEVGTGKTYTMVAAAMESKRLGLSTKPAITCLKANIEQITNDAQKLYPGARILSTLGNFDKADRKNMVARMATGDYDLIILTHDNIDMLPMFPETRAKYIKEELKELEEVILAAEMSGSGSKRGNRLVKSLEKSKAKLEADMLEILEKNKDDAVNFEQTGIDCLFVDEAHKYKSLKVITRQDRVKGIPTGRSDRATNMLARVRWLQEQHDGRGVAFATGTPIANSTAELFNLQRYLQWDELNERGLRSFDAWASVFGETVTKIEKTATGNYKEVTRFAKFTNQSELLQMVGMVMDVKLAKDMPNVLRPQRSDEVIQSDLSDEQHAYQIGLQYRAEQLKGKYIREKGSDNMLAISNDARKMSLDMRLVDPTAADNPDSKVNKCVANVLEIARTRPDVTQMIFSDIGVHKNDYGFSVYDDIITKLVAGGIERDQIIDFSQLTEVQRKGAIDRLARGEAKVALGSTDKLGTGVNAQQHLYAAHNLDVPWLPAYVTQRDGRIWRQGNKHEAQGEPIKIYRYVTVGGFDELMWQTVDRKLQFINDIMEGKTNGVREVAEVDGEELTPAQIAAIASGNPDILRKVELEDAIGELERAARRHQQSQLRLADDALQIESRIERHERSIELLKEDLETYTRHTVGEDGEKVEEFSAEIKGRQFDKRKDAALELEAAFMRARDGDVIGRYKGFPIVCRSGQAFGEKFSELYLAGNAEGGYELNFATAEGAFASMDSALRGIEKRIAAHTEQIQVLNVNAEKISAEVGKPFKGAEELTTLRAELSQVEGRLKAANENKADLKLSEGRMTFEEVDAEVYLRNAGVVKELRAIADEGGTIIKIDNTPVGWLKQSKEGVLEAIEIKEEYQRKGVATRAITMRFEGRQFTSLYPNDAGKALLDSIGEVERDANGRAVVTPLQRIPTPEPPKQKAGVFNAYHTVRYDEDGQPKRNYAGQLGEGMYLALNTPWTWYDEKEEVQEKHVEIAPAKICDPHGLIPGTNVEKSKADKERAHERTIELLDEQGVPRDALYVKGMSQDDYVAAHKARSQAVRELGYEAEVDSVYQDEWNGRGGNVVEMVVYDREKVQDGHAAAPPAPPVVIVGYQTRVAISAEEKILAEYPDVTDAAMQGYSQQTGREMSAEGRAVFARLLIESAGRPASAEQLEMVATLSEEAGEVVPPEVKNELEAAAYIARERTDIAGAEMWVQTAILAEQEAAQSQQRGNTSDVGRFHRGNGAERSYGVSLALDAPFSRTQTEGRETVDVKYVAVAAARIFDPQSLVPGTDAEKARADRESLNQRLAEAGMTGTSDRTAKARTEILKELGYEAEARRMDGNADTKLRELIVFDLEAVKPLERSVEPANVLQRLPEWRERAEKTQRLESERPARVISGNEVVARLKLEHAEHCHTAAVEQTDLRRYKVTDVDGDERRISVRDIELRAKAIAHREVARRMGAAMAEQQEQPVGTRKPARVVRQELQDEVIGREMSRHEETIRELQTKHDEVIEKLEGEVERARSAYELAVEDAVEEAARHENRLPEPIIAAATLTELHDDAVDRGDAGTITRLDRLRQRLIREFGPEAERNDHDAARLVAQHRMAELQERVTARTLEKFEESYHLRRFDIEGRNRYDYLPEQRGAQSQQDEHERDERWSLKDVAQAQQTVTRSRDWLLKNAEHYDRQTAFKTLFDQTMNPLNEVKAQIRFVTNPMQAMENHLPHRMLLNHPAVQGLRFVMNYSHAREQADECRRLAELEEQKLSDLAEIRDEVTEQIGLKRAEIKADLARETEMSGALKKAVNSEKYNRLLNSAEMPKAEFEEHEIRRIESHAMELRDGSLLEEYEAAARTAKASGLLEEEDLAARSVGRETTAEARVLSAEARLAALSQPIAAAETVAATEQVLTVKALTMVRVNVEGVEQVTSLRDAATAPEEVRAAVERAVEQHEARLVREVAEAQDFHEAAKGIADSYRAGIDLAAGQTIEAQFSVKEHLEIERFAAGIEDDALHARFSEIADGALSDGRIIGIEKSLAVPPEQTQVQAEASMMQTAEFELDITAADAAAESRAGLNALERAANYGAALAEPSIGSNGNGNGHGLDNGNGNGAGIPSEVAQTGVDVNSPTTATALEMDDATLQQQQLAEAEAAEVEEAAAVDFLIL